MKRIGLNMMKICLSVITNAAFLFILLNVNTTCCGPAYQPTLPLETKNLKFNKKVK